MPEALNLTKERLAEYKNAYGLITTRILSVVGVLAPSFGQGGC